MTVLKNWRQFVAYCGRDSDARCLIIYKNDEMKLPSGMVEDGERSKPVFTIHRKLTKYGYAGTLREVNYLFNFDKWGDTMEVSGIRVITSTEQYAVKADKEALEKLVRNKPDFSLVSLPDAISNLSSDYDKDAVNMLKEVLESGGFGLSGPEYNYSKPQLVSDEPRQA